MTSRNGRERDPAEPLRPMPRDRVVNGTGPPPAPPDPATNPNAGPAHKGNALPFSDAPIDRLAPWQILGLKPEQEEFCRLRIAHPDKSGTALVRLIDAYATRTPGMQTNIAHLLRKNAAVQTRIRQLEREAVRAVEKRKRHKLNAKRVVRELSNVAFSDIRALLDIDGDTVRVRSSSDWPDAAAAAVASAVNTPEGVKLTFYDKLHALRSLAKILRLLPEEPAQAHPGGLVIGKAVIYIPDNGRPMLNEQQQLEFDDPDPQSQPSKEDESQ